MIRITFFMILLTQFAFSQKPSATIENLSIHQAKEDDEDINADFPIVHSPNASVDLKINNALQTAFFGGPLTEKSIAAIRKEYSPIGAYTFSHSEQIMDRFIIITIGRHQTNNAMSLNGYTVNYPMMFDLRTGQRFSPLAMFSDEGVLLFLGKAFRGLRQSYNETMDRYLEGFSKMKSAKQTEVCDCNCEDILQDVFRNDYATFSYSKDGIALQMDACSWMNPGPHDIYGFSISMNDLRPLLSDFGKYMIDNGPDAGSPTRTAMLFQGKLGDNIHTSFVLRRQANNELTGYEIYNSVGATIKLQGKITGTQYTFDEVTAEGKPVATFKAELKDGHLTGNWTKSDKSKTLGFGAVLYP